VNPDDIRKRQTFVEGRPLKDRLKEASFIRRDGNFVEEERVDNIEFDTFFDYEDDLAGLTASNQQVAGPITLERKSGPVVMEELIDMPTATHGGLEIENPLKSTAPITMRPVYSKDSAPGTPAGISAGAGTGSKEGVGTDPGTRSYDDVVGFEFIRCEHIMKNGSRCRRQAPKHETICSIHKKMLKKINNI
jgi:hypothetical protein